MEEKKRNTFTGSLGFVMAAAASAVGLGNIWRFPYLAARDGGGIFLVVYLILTVTFGFTLLTTEIAIGRKTRQSALTAYGHLRAGWKPLGFFACVVPMLIMPYYCVIGGWVIKYFWIFLTGQGFQAAADGYFMAYRADTWMPIVTFAIFLLFTVLVVLGGVQKGIEKFSKIMMPVLVVFILGLSVFSLTLSFKDETGAVRTGLEGLRILIVPNFKGITLSSFLSIVMDAMGQLFYSLSVAMGIMIAFGSYMKDETNLHRCVSEIEIFDTGIAFLAAVMIIPAVYVFMGNEGLKSSGPGLMFESLPRVFEQMGTIGNVIGAVFFALVFFAALTSSVSILEAIVSSFMDQFGLSRKAALSIETVIAFVIGVIVCLGYNVLYFVFRLPNGSDAQVLDILDYLSNNLMMPAISTATCILIGWLMTPDTIIDEVTKNGERFIRKKLYRVMVRFVAPVLLVILLLKAIGIMR